MTGASEASEDELPGACMEARAAMTAFVEGGFKIGSDAERQERMRGHLAECEGCDQAYRDLIEQVAAFRGVAERRHVAEARRARGLSAKPRGRGIGAMSVLFMGSGKEPSNKLLATLWRLKPLLMVAFFMFLITRLLDFSGGGRMTVERVSGAVVVDDRPMSDAAPSRIVGQVGSFVTLDGELRVVRTAYGAEPPLEVRIAPHSGVLLTGRRPLRFLQTSGSASFDGALELVVEALVLSTPGLRPPADAEHDPEGAAFRCTIVSGEGSEAPGEVLIELDAGALEYLSSSGAGTLEAPARIRFNALGQVMPLAPSGV